jgi:hypothetical protein
MDWFMQEVAADVDRLFRHDRSRMRAYATLRIDGYSPTDAARRLGMLPTSTTRMERRFTERLRGYLNPSQS